MENIRELARLRGAGLTETVEAAVRETLERERARQVASLEERRAEAESLMHDLSLVVAPIDAGQTRIAASAV